MKRNSLLFMLLSTLFFNTAHAKTLWAIDPHGCKLWWGSEKYLESVRWSGACRNGYASGNGVAIYTLKNSAKDIYRGEMKKGKLNGSGRYEWANKNIYMGEWKNSKAHGQGTHLWSDGKKYIGTWKNHRREGKGKMTWEKPCPSCYQSFVGNFSNDSFDSGVYTLGNGKKINKKKSKVSDTTSLYLDLMQGYLTNRHLHYGN